MHGIAPALTERVFAREVEKRDFQDRAVPPSEGNLFKPMHGFNQMSGGWRSTPRGQRSFSNVLLGAAALGAGFGLLIRRSLGRRYTKLRHSHSDRNALSVGLPCTVLLVQSFVIGLNFENHEADLVCRRF